MRGSLDAAPCSPCHTSTNRRGRAKALIKVLELIVAPGGSCESFRSTAFWKDRAVPAASSAGSSPPRKSAKLVVCDGGVLNDSAGLGWASC